jgi:hypothetical protein
MTLKPFATFTLSLVSCGCWVNHRQWRTGLPCSRWWASNPKLSFNQLGFAMEMQWSSLFSNVTQLCLVVGYRRFGTIYRSRLEGLSSFFLDCLTVANQLPTYARRAKTSNTPRRKSEISYEAQRVQCIIGTELIYPNACINFLQSTEFPNGKSKFL